jgi:hypothetical protein
MCLRYSVPSHFLFIFFLSHFIKDKYTSLPYDKTIQLIEFQKRNKYPYKDLYIIVHRTFIYNSPKQKIIPMTINRLMNKQTAIHPKAVLPLSHRKK